jgi:DHA1 family tetracycline resistance protein-like MFS transporter
LIGAAFGLGFIFGPAIGGILSHFSLAAPFFFAAGLAALNSVAVYFFLPESLKPEHHAQPHRASVLDLFREAQGNRLSLVIGAYFFTTVAFSMLMATYPLFASHRFGYGAPQVGYIFAAMGVLGAIIQGGMLGWLLKILNDRVLAMLGAVVLGVGLVLLPSSSTPAMLVMATAAMALGHGLVAAPMNGLASKSIGATAQGRVLGIMQSSASLARVAGPVLGGFLLNWELTHGYPHFGRLAYWTGAAVVLLSLAFMMAIRIQETGST